MVSDLERLVLGTGRWGVQRSPTIYGPCAERGIEVLSPSIFYHIVRSLRGFTTLAGQSQITLALAKLDGCGFSMVWQAAHQT